MQWEDELHDLGKGRRGKSGLRLRRIGGGQSNKLTASYSDQLVKSAQGRPEAFAKVIKNSPRGIRVKALFNYVARVGKDLKEQDTLEPDASQLSLEDGYGRVYSSKEDISQLYKEWKKDFEDVNDASQRKSRHVYHMVLSAKVPQDEKGFSAVEKVRQSALETVRKNIGDNGYDFVMGLHGDTDHVHAHVVIKARHSFKKEKIRLNPKELFSIRRDFAKELTRNGLEHVATGRRDRGLEKKEKRDSFQEKKFNGEQDVKKKLEAFLKGQEIKLRKGKSGNVFLMISISKKQHEAMREELKGSALTELERKKAFNDLRRFRRKNLDKMNVLKAKQNLLKSLDRKVFQLESSLGGVHDDLALGKFLTPEAEAAREKALNSRFEAVREEIGNTEGCLKEFCTPSEEKEILKELELRRKSLSELQDKKRYDVKVNNKLEIVEEYKRVVVEGVQKGKSFNAFREGKKLQEATDIIDDYLKSKKYLSGEQREKAAVKTKGLKEEIEKKWESKEFADGAISSTTDFFKKWKNHLEKQQEELTKARPVLSVEEYRKNLERLGNQKKQFSKEIDITIHAVRNSKGLPLESKTRARKAMQQLQKSLTKNREQSFSK